MHTQRGLRVVQTPRRACATRSKAPARFVQASPVAPQVLVSDAAATETSLPSLHSWRKYSPDSRYILWGYHSALSTLTMFELPFKCNQTLPQRHVFMCVQRWHILVVLCSLIIASSSSKRKHVEVSACAAYKI